MVQKIQILPKYIVQCSAINSLNGDINIKLQYLDYDYTLTIHTLPNMTTFSTDLDCCLRGPRVRRQVKLCCPRRPPISSVSDNARFALMRLNWRLNGLNPGVGS